jgi:hypothetical protein
MMVSCQQAKSGGDMGFASRAQSAADSRASNNNSGGSGGQSKGTDAANKKG